MDEEKQLKALITINPLNADVDLSSLSNRAQDANDVFRSRNLCLNY